MQRPHRANRCQGLGLVLAVDLEAVAGALQAPRELQEFPANRPPLAAPFFPAGSGFAGGVGGTGAWLRAAISALISF